MFILNQYVNSLNYSPSIFIESKINTIGSVNCDGTYLNLNDYYVEYFIRPKSSKLEILEVFSDEKYFDIDDEIAAENEIRRLIVKKEENFYNYYD